MTEEKPRDHVSDLRTALSTRSSAAAAALMARVHLGVEVLDGDQPGVVKEGERRKLPVFLSHDSWLAFRSPHDLRVLEPSQFKRLLEALDVDAVLFDPSLPEATEVPAAEVMSMLLGETVDSDGRHVVGQQLLLPDVELRESVRQALSGVSLRSDLWVGRRVNAGGSVPTISFASATPDAEIEAVVQSLAGSALPRDLEVVRLPDSVDLEEIHWEDLKVSAVRP